MALIHDYQYTPVDFEHPSFLFVMEDLVKDKVGGPLLYNSYIKSFGLKGNEKVLDFGCGGGTGSKCILNYLNGSGYLTCLDTSEYWMKKAEKRLGKYPNVECITGEIGDLNIPDHTYDVITIFHVLHDIKPKKRAEVVNTLSRILKNGGNLFLREPTRKSHGMAVSEIRSLLKTANFRETTSEEDKSEYKGKFLKIR